MFEIVECRSDYEYAQQPLALVWQGQRLEVLEVLRQWRSPSSKHFMILTKDQRVFNLAYHEAEDCWSVDTDEISDKNIDNLSSN